MPLSAHHVTSLHTALLGLTKFSSLVSLSCEVPSGCSLVSFPWTRLLSCCVLPPTPGSFASLHAPSLCSVVSQPHVFLYLLQCVHRDLDFSASILAHCLVCFSLSMSWSLLSCPYIYLIFPFCDTVSVSSQKSLWFLIPMLSCPLPLS